MRSLVAALLASLGLAALPALAQPQLACRETTIVRGMEAKEVRALCGKPVKKDKRTPTVTQKDARGTAVRSWTVEFEEWTYESEANRRNVWLLRFVNGELMGLKLRAAR